MKGRLRLRNRNSSPADHSHWRIEVLFRIVEIDRKGEMGFRGDWVLQGKNNRQFREMQAAEGAKCHPGAGFGTGGRGKGRKDVVLWILLGSNQRPSDYESDALTG